MRAQQIEIEVSRGCNGAFELMIVGKRKRQAREADQIDCRRRQKSYQQRDFGLFHGRLRPRTPSAGSPAE